MSEVLRAIMDKNCVDSRTAFYSAQFAPHLLPNAGQAFARFQASIACKSDTYFLAMGASFDSAFSRAVGPYVWDNKAMAAQFIVQRGRNQENYGNILQQQSLQNYNLNNWVTWDEYVLFKPAELIVVLGDIVSEGGSNTGTNYSFVTLMGVEYQMPAGMGDS